MTLLLDTWRALLQPRRAIAIAVVSAPLLAAQWQFSDRGLAAEAIAIAMVAVFVALGPFAWRALFPPGAPVTLGRLALYGLVGAIPTALGEFAPALAHLRDSFLARGLNGFVIATLFWVGGWGLARDVDLEGAVERERSRAERLALEAERARLLAIRAHLDPHFLFNTLNAIAEWCREDPVVAEQAILKLSGLLREVLGGLGSASWPLRREIELARDVWALHQLRDPSWFTVDEQVDPGALDVPVPPLTLLPLVENAVKHGPARGHRGALVLAVRLDGDHVRVRIENPGRFGGPRDGGTGLDTVRKRLALTWGGRGSLEIGGQDRTVAELRFPAGAEVA